MSMFIPLPKPDGVELTSLNLMLSAFLLMKVAGQESASMADLKMLAHDYAGYKIVYDENTESWTFTLVTRTDEYPRPELTQAGA